MFLRQWAGRSFLGFMLAAVAVGCGTGDGTDGGGFQDETGSFSYDYRVSGCATGRQVFSQKSEYCRALTDRARNSGCALEQRRNTYGRECVGAFLESNIVPRRYSGYDTVLRRSCATQDNRGDALATLNQYCEFLKDETLHQQCFWERRKAEFQQEKCPGDFSAPPAGVTPTPVPSANPTPVPTLEPRPVPRPTPTERPDPRPDVARELEAAGIKVVLAPDQYPMPGEEPYEWRLEAFWPVLEALKGELIARNGAIGELSLSTYTLYNSSRRELTLDVDFNVAELGAYFPYLDRRLALERKAEIRFELGIEIYGHEEQKFAELGRKLGYFEGRLEGLKALSPAVQVVKLESYSRYRVQDRELYLNKDRFEEELENTLTWLPQLSAFFAFADEKGLKVQGLFDADKYRENFIKSIKVLHSERGSLLELMDRNELTRIELSDYRDKTALFSGELRPAAREPGLGLLAEVIKALANQGRLAEGLEIPVETRLDLDANYLETIRRLKLAFATIRSKRGSIARIQLSGKSDYSYKTLYLGYEGTVEDLQKVLARIP